MVISFSKFKNGCGGATGGTVSGITLWSADYTREYIDSVVSGYTKTEDFATINGSAITEGGNLVIQGGSGGTEYYAGTNIDITNNVISVTGITVPTDISDLVDDIGIATTAWTNSAITGTMSAYTPTSAFTTINGSAITEGGNIIVEGTPYSGGTGIGVENHIISVTGDYETVVELTQAEYDALTAYSENTTYIITDAPAINMSAYTPTSGFSTINGSAITTGDAIVIETGGNYSAGTNIDITNDVISVTGITVPTKLSDLTNDSGFITQNDIPTSNTAFTNDAGFVNSGEVETQITSKDYPTKNWVQGHVSLAIAAETARTESTYAKIGDIPSLDGYATTGWVESQGYLKEHQDISGKLDTSAFTAYTATTQTELNNKQDASAMTQYATTAFTESTYLKEHQSLNNYYTSAQTESAISSAITGVKTEIEAEIPTKLSDLQNDLNFVNSGQVQTQIESQGYITGYTETDPVFQASAASGITSQDITNWDAKLDSSALTPYYTSAQTDTAISNAVSGKADSSAVTAQISDAKEEIEAEIPTKLSDLQNDLNFVNSGDVKTQIEGYNYINSGQAQTQIDSSISSAIAAETARTESTYLKEHQSLSAYSTTQQVQSLINTAKQEVEGEIPDVSDFVTSAQVNTQIESKGYITGYTETDPVFMASAASGITANDITNWNGKQPAGDYALRSELPTVPTSNTAFTNDAGYITDAALNGYATTAFTEQTYLKEHQSLSAYTPTSGMATINGSAITEGGNLIIQGGGASYSAGTNIDITNDVISVTGITVPTNTSQLTNDSRFIPYTTTSSVGILGVRVLTQAQYDALSPANPNTIYIIVG